MPPPELQPTVITRPDQTFPGRMWTLTEFDGRRTVFGVPVGSIGAA